jgi:hypothetical protein
LKFEIWIRTKVDSDDVVAVTLLAWIAANNVHLWLVHDRSMLSARGHLVVGNVVPFASFYQAEKIRWEAYRDKIAFKINNNNNNIDTENWNRGIK